MAHRAAQAAADHPDNLRMQRKAAELAEAAIRIARYRHARIKPDTILAWADPALSRLQTGPQACATSREAGYVFEAAGHDKDASAIYLRTVDQCHSPLAAIAAARTLRAQHKCKTAIHVIAGVWRYAEQEEQVPLLDAVNMCSSSVSLAQNLSFAPKSVVQSYFGLLRQRAAQRREQARRRREEQLRSDCRSHCTQARWDCEDSCRGNGCYDSCSALENACDAGCAR